MDQHLDRPDQSTDPHPHIALSRTELVVARLTACGLTNDVIAAQLHRSNNTVKTHLRRLMNKTSTRNRYQLVAWLYETGHLVAGQRTFSTPRPTSPTPSPARHGDHPRRVLPVITKTCADLDSALAHLGSL